MTAAEEQAAARAICRELIEQAERNGHAALAADLRRLLGRLCRPIIEQIPSEPFQLGRSRIRTRVRRR